MPNIISVLGAVIGVYQYINNSTTSKFDNLFKEEVAIANHAAASGAYMLQSRRNEKDFLIRKDKKYIQKLEKNVALLKSEAQRIVDLAEKIGDSESASKASAKLNVSLPLPTSFQ